MSLTPVTELEAVNFMLESIGELPVNTLDTPGVTEASLAYSNLIDTSRNFQARGWHFNTEQDYPLALNESYQVPVPTNTLKLETMDRTLQVIQRGTKLYDKKNHTYTFTTAPLVEISFFLSFDELPQAVRHYVTVVASRSFQRSVIGSDTLNGLTQEDELKALSAVMEQEADIARYSIFNSYSTARPILRNQNPLPMGT